jgi:phenylalanyl-tRNA synthetase alpha chain
MQTQPPPIRIIAPGVVYRRDDDATHSPMFSQIEGLAVDEHIRFSDLKGVLTTSPTGSSAPAGSRSGSARATSRSSSPASRSTSPAVLHRGAGCRLCKGTGWIEIGGAGMVDPEVFAHVGKVDAEVYTGFAFGMGIERMAMLRHGVNDIKLYYEGDLRFLEQF